MLQDIRNSAQSTAAKVVVWLIVVTFALFGVESIVGGLSGEPEIATVNGEDIPESRFMRALEGKRRQILAQMGDRADPDLIDENLLRQSVLEGMIEETILAQDAEGKGLYVPDAYVDAYIRTIPQFQVDGEFSNERLQMLLRNAGLTLKDYRSSLKREFLIGQPRSGLIASAFVLKPEQNELLALDRQTRDFGLATVFKGDYLESIVVSDEEIAEYYADNKEDFQKPRNVDVAFVELKRLDLGADLEISEDELRTAYETEKSEYVGEEERNAAHILVKIDDQRSEEDALALIQELQSKLAAGEDFAALAKEFSEDEGSSADSGELGFSARGVYVADFEDALFALQPGAVSGPVKTEFGYHLIKLIDVRQNDIPPFEEMRYSIESRLQEQKASSIYAEQAELLADIAYSAPDLAEPAEELGLEIKELAGVSETSSDPLFSNIKLQRLLFAPELVKEGLNSDLIEVDDGHAVVFRVAALHEASTRPLDEVKDLIRQRLAQDKAAEFAESVGQAFIVRVKAGEAPDVVANDMGLQWVQHKEIRRDNVMLDREVVTRVFTLNKADDIAGNVHGFSVLDGDYSVVVLEDVKDGDASDITSVERRSVMDMLSGSFGAGDYQNYQKAAVRDAEVERL